MHRLIFCLTLSAVVVFGGVSVRGDKAAEQLVLATYKLSNASSTGTGLAVVHPAGDGESRLVVITANHVLERMVGDACLLVSRRKQPTGIFLRQDIRIPIRSAGKRLWKKTPEHDLAVLPLPAAIEVFALTIDSLAPEERIRDVYAGDDVRLAVFPERAEANSAGFPVLRAGCISSFPLLPLQANPTFLVDTTAWTGDSGGPVMHNSLRSPTGGPVVVGIVRGMRNVTDMVKESRFVERRTHYPLGLSEVMHVDYARRLLDGS